MTIIEHDNLEDFQDPANYDIENGDDDHPRLSLYGDLAVSTGGPMLELACGSGLVTIPIVRRGLEAVGVDLARPMLDHARSKSAGLPVEWAEGDVRSVRLGRRFRFVLLTGNAFQAMLTDADQAALVATAAAHLLPGGLFAFETRNPSGTSLEDSREEEHWLTYTDVAGNTVDYSGTQRYDPARRVLHWTSYRRWREGDTPRETVTRVACRFSDPDEVRALLERGGLEVLHQYGGWDKAPLTAASPTIISVARMPA